MSGPGSKKGPFSRRNRLSPVQYAGRSFNSSLRYSPTQWLLLIPCVGALFPPFSSCFFFFFYCILCLASGKPVFPYTHTQTNTRTTTHTHTWKHKASPSPPPSPLQFLYVLICVDNCTNLPILPWNSTVTWWCSNQCVTVRVIRSFTPFRSPFKMPISSRMRDQNRRLHKEQLP